MKVKNHFLAMFIVVLSLAFSMRTNVSAAQQDGLAQNENGVWCYYVSGEVDNSYTGLANVGDTWWYVQNGVINFDYNGIVPFGDAWWCVAGGRVCTEYTGLWSDPSVGWWYIKDGTIDFSYNGMIPYGDAWWCVAGGRVCFEYTGLWNDPSIGWWYIQDGTINFNYFGMIPYADAWWCVVGGQVRTDYTGLWSDPSVGWWYIKDGVIDFSYNGYVPYNDVWWCVAGGRVCFEYTGLWSDPSVGWWYSNNGAIDFSYNGFAEFADSLWCVGSGRLCFEYTGLWNDSVLGWKYVKEGRVDTTFTGLAELGGNLWYVKEGSLMADYTGVITYAGSKYYVKNGLATKVGDSGDSGEDIDDSINTPTPGLVDHTTVSGTIEDGVYYIRSASNKNMVLTVSNVEKDRGYNLVLSKDIGADNQKFRVYKLESGQYMITSVVYADDNNFGWLLNAPNFGWNEGPTDNVAVTPDSVQGGKTWLLNETDKTGIYNIKVVRGDDTELFLSVVNAINTNANIGTAAAGVNAEYNFTFAKAYERTLPDGYYSIATGDNALVAKSLNNDGNVNVTALTGDSDQVFRFTCVDADKALYSIINVNTNKSLYIKGSNVVGSDVLLMDYTGSDDHLWYVERRADGSYTIVNYMTRLALNVSGDKIVQSRTADLTAEKYTLRPWVQSNPTAANGVYKVGDKNYRISYEGFGKYVIWSVADNGYLTADGSSVKFAADESAINAKWVIGVSGSSYTIQSAANNKYLNAALSGLTDTASAVAMNDVTASITDYRVKYDLRLFDNIAANCADYKIVKIMNKLNPDIDELMNPVPTQAAIEADILANITTSHEKVVDFTGNTVEELNDFLAKNMGSTVRLTQDINVYYEDNITKIGTILIPSNTILDGNGHKLVKTGNLPDFGIAFFYIDKSSGPYKMVYSSNAGVINLKSDLEYAQETVNIMGADRVYLANNEFKNAKTYSILMAAEENNNNDLTNYALIKNNVLSDNGMEAIRIVGGHSNIICERNTISNLGVYGILVTNNADSTEAAVDEVPVTDIPKNIVIKNNSIDNTGRCPLYFIGAYKAYVTGNKLTNGKMEGICFDYGCVGGYFANNEVSGCGADNTLPGIAVDTGIYCIIDGNYTHDNVNHGIRLVRGALGTVIVNNNCENNGTEKMVQGGKLVAGIVIEDASLTEADNRLDALGSNYNVVYGNTISGRSTVGVGIMAEDGTDDCSHNIVKYNIFGRQFTYNLIDLTRGDNEAVNNYVVK